MFHFISKMYSSTFLKRRHLSELLATLSSVPQVATTRTYLLLWQLLLQCRAMLPPAPSQVLLKGKSFLPLPTASRYAYITHICIRCLAAASGPVCSGCRCCELSLCAARKFDFQQRPRSSEWLVGTQTIGCKKGLDVRAFYNNNNNNSNNNNNNFIMLY
jgi:hypothetical protein